MAEIKARRDEAGAAAVAEAAAPEPSTTEGLVAHKVGHIHIRREDTAYSVMFTPGGTGQRRLLGEDNLRSFLAAADIPADRIEQAAIALRQHTEHAIPNVVLTLERMSKLGL